MPIETARTQSRSLDRLVKALVLALVVAVMSFGAYYYFDRRGTASPDLHDRAIEQAQQAVKADPGSAAARLALADAYLERNYHAEAIAQYDSALQLDDTLTDAHRGLGISYFEQSQFAQAEQELRKVIDGRKAGQFANTDKALAEAYYFQASAQVSQQRPADAIPALESALRIDRADADAWQLLGAAYLASSKPDEAVKALKQAVLFAPKYPEAYQALARAYGDIGDAPRARYAQAMVLYSQGNNDQAIADLRAVTSANSDVWEAWTGLGLAHEAKLQKKEAAEAFHRALAGSPDDFNARAGLARVAMPRS